MELDNEVLEKNCSPRQKIICSITFANNFGCMTEGTFLSCKKVVLQTSKNMLNCSNQSKME